MKEREGDSEGEERERGKREREIITLILTCTKGSGKSLESCLQLGKSILISDIFSVLQTRIACNISTGHLKRSIIYSYLEYHCSNF